jgi:hypothetical protein
MASMELLGRSLLQGSAGPAAAAPRGARDRRSGGLCYASLGGRSSRRSVRSKAPVGALAERVVLAPAPAERVARPEAHPQSVAARAVVTVRRKRKDDAKGRVAEQMDAYADKLGRSVLLELVSTETDPSKQPTNRPPRSFVFIIFELSCCSRNLLLRQFVFRFSPRFPIRRLSSRIFQLVRLDLRVRACVRAPVFVLSCPHPSTWKSRAHTYYHYSPVFSI